MNVQSRTSLGAMGAALQQQALGGQLISKTLDKLNGSSCASAASCGSSAAYDFQKSVLSAAYAAEGIGTKVDTVV